MNDLKAVIYILIGASSYGILSTIVKLAYDNGFQPNEVTGSQAFFGVLILVGLIFLFGKRESLSIRHWLLLLLVGIISGLTGVFYYSALQFVPASIGIVLLFQFTWMGVLMESILDRRRPSVEKILSILFLLAGTLFAGDILATGLTTIPIVGIVLGLLSAATYAGFILASGRLVPHVNPWMRSMILGLGSFIVVCVTFPPHFLINGSLFHGLWFWGLLLAFFGIVLPNLLFTYGVPKVGAGIATILGAVELPMAVLLSRFVLQEQVSGVQWIGVVLILVGIVMAEMRLTKRQMVNG
ncbi:MAG TPA: DMT family transporter [Bacillota bacterium]|nr:DMT family transporter [Bacillota bacterium]